MNERWREQREFRLRVITSDPAKDVRRGNYWGDREKASVLMQRLSYPTETVLSNKITRNRIVLSFKGSPRKPLRRRPLLSAMWRSRERASDTETISQWRFKMSKEQGGRISVGGGGGKRYAHAPNTDTAPVASLATPRFHEIWLIHFKHYTLHLKAIKIGGNRVDWDMGNLRHGLCEIFSPLRGWV